MQYLGTLTASSSPQRLHITTSHSPIHSSRIETSHPLALFFTKQISTATSAPSSASRSIEDRLSAWNHQPQYEVADAISQSLRMSVDGIKRQILRVSLAVVSDERYDDIRNGTVQRGGDASGQKEDLVRTCICQSVYTTPYCRGLFGLVMQYLYDIYDAHDRCRACDVADRLVDRYGYCWVFGSHEC